MINSTNRTNFQLSLISDFKFSTNLNFLNSMVAIDSDRANPIKHQRKGIVAGPDNSWLGRLLLAIKIEMKKTKEQKGTKNPENFGFKEVKTKEQTKDNKVMLIQLILTFPFF